MELLDGIFKMEYMKDNVSKEKKKDLEDFYIMMAHFIKDTGFKTNMKVMEKKLLNVKMSMKEIGNMAKKMETES